MVVRQIFLWGWSFGLSGPPYLPLVGPLLVPGPSVGPLMAPCCLFVFVCCLLFACFLFVCRWLFAGVLLALFACFWLVLCKLVVCLLYSDACLLLVFNGLLFVLLLTVCLHFGCFLFVLCSLCACLLLAFYLFFVDLLLVSVFWIVDVVCSGFVLDFCLLFACLLVGFKLCVHFVPTLCRLCIGFVPILCRLCADFVPTLCWLCADFVPILCRLCADFGPNIRSSRRADVLKHLIDAAKQKAASIKCHDIRSSRRADDKCTNVRSNIIEYNRI